MRSVISGRLGLDINWSAYLNIVNLPCNNQEKHDALDNRPPLDARIR